jgi:hypothetical protein
MTYKDRLTFLGSLNGALILIYIVSAIVTSDIGVKSSSFTWLDSKSAGKVLKITVNDIRNDSDLELRKKNYQWFVLNNGVEYPAKQLRVEDLLKILTTRSAWPVRSTSAGTHERFGLEQPAFRITIFAETVLLDLLVGNEDIFKNEIYMRKAGQNEVRAGDNAIKSYLSGPAASWYNLRLIPESENGSVDLSSIQRLSVYTPQETVVFSRKNRKWEVSGVNPEKADQNNIDNYIRQVITVEGENFDDSIKNNDPSFDTTSISIELGNGRIITIRFTPADESGGRFAHVSGKDYVYYVSSWAVGKIFRSASSFESQ